MHFSARSLWIKALLSEDGGMAVQEALAALVHAESAIESTLEQGNASSSAPLMLLRPLFGFGSSSTAVDAASAPPPLSESLRLLYRALLGEIHIMSALLHLRKGGWVRGGLALRKGWKLHESLAPRIPSIANFLKSDIDDDENSASMPELELGSEWAELEWSDQLLRSMLMFTLGAFYFFVSLVPSSFQWVVEAIGFRGSRALGVELLRLVSVADCPASPVALLLLIWIQTFFYDNATVAKQLLAKSETDYPQGMFLIFFYHLPGFLF
jgi:hypothetical protein